MIRVREADVERRCHPGVTTPMELENWSEVYSPEDLAQRERIRAELEKRWYPRGVSEEDIDNYVVLDWMKESDAITVPFYDPSCWTFKRVVIWFVGVASVACAIGWIWGH